MEKSKKTNNINRISRLFWACRRGMLELDMLLGRFLEKCYPTLSPGEQQLFEQLLTYEDQVLYEWLLGSEQPEDVNLLKMINMIRANARS